VDLKLVEKVVQLHSVEFGPGTHKTVYGALFGTIRTAAEAILSEEADDAALKNYSTIFEKLLRLRQSCCSATLVTCFVKFSSNKFSTSRTKSALTAGNRLRRQILSTRVQQ